MIDLLLLPFRAVWALTVTLIGAVIGVPLLIVGFLLIVRSLLR